MPFNGGETIYLKSAPLRKVKNGSESTWSKINLQGKHHYIGSWYRPPDSPADNISLLKDQFGKIKQLGKTHQQPCIHALSDFNYRKNKLADNAKQGLKLLFGE